MSSASLYKTHPDTLKFIRIATAVYGHPYWMNAIYTSGDASWHLVMINQGRSLPTTQDWAHLYAGLRRKAKQLNELIERREDEAALHSPHDSEPIQFKSPE